MAKARICKLCRERPAVVRNLSRDASPYADGWDDAIDRVLSALSPTKAEHVKKD